MKQVLNTKSTPDTLYIRGYCCLRLSLRDHTLAMLCPRNIRSLTEVPGVQKPSSLMCNEKCVCPQLGKFGTPRALKSRRTRQFYFHHSRGSDAALWHQQHRPRRQDFNAMNRRCLLYTSPSPRDKRQSRMPSSA